MCGILVASGAAQSFHHRLLNGLRRRGPDGVGFWTDGRTHMAHTRLAVIGLDDRGVEPMENETHVLAYNGEVYNFLDLSRRLLSEGAPVTFANDAETVLEGWSRWGPKLLADAVGFWAFCIYDKQARRLTLVRDQLGIKPLYYWQSTSGFFAASSISAIVKAAGRTPPLDYEAMSEYVRYQFTFGDKTFFSGVRKVCPGHLVEFDLDSGAISDRCYEDILSPDPAEREKLSPEWIDQTRELLTECCVDSTISDTSFTTFCSGGLDSSAITRLTAPEIAYHCNYSDPECNETAFAQAVVEGTDTRLFVVNAQERFDLVAKLRSIIEDFDELSVGSVVLPLDDLLAQVKRRYKVILTGTGGDELLGGYARYGLAMGRCSQDSYSGLFAKMQALPTVADRFELAHSKGAVGWYKFYEPRVQTTFKTAFQTCGADDPARMLSFDRRYFLTALLNIDDKLCGRHSLEARPSLLHQQLVRRLVRLDPAELLGGDQLKAVGRKLLEPVLPASVLARNDKMGFTTPIGDFVNRSAHLIREQLAGSRFRDLYDMRHIKLTADSKFSREVFGLLMLDLWLNRYAAAGA